MVKGVQRHISKDQFLVTHAVYPKHAGVRLDRFLMERYRHRSREQLKRAIESGAITVIREGSTHLHAGRMKASFGLQPGDVVRVLSTRHPEPEVNFNYRILYEDADIAVVDKPPNLPVHPSGRFFFNSLLIHLKTDGYSKELRLERDYFLVHRIDKETSGVLLIAKTREACNVLTAQFRNRETQKYYLAIVHGAPTEKTFTVNQPIGRIPKNRVGLKMYPLSETEGGLSSLTDFEVVETRVGNASQTYTLLACFPKTGRQHQIRSHAEIAGYPLVGDKVYGMSDDDVFALLDGHRESMKSEVRPEPISDFGSDLDEDLSDELTDELDGDDDGEPESFQIPGPTLDRRVLARYAELKSKLLLPRHALHAAGLRFTHPTTGKVMTFESPLPDDLRTFFEGITEAPLQPFKTNRWA